MVNKLVWFCMTSIVAFWQINTDPKSIIKNKYYFKKSPIPYKNYSELASTFDGVNWADARDNFVDGPIIPSGINPNLSTKEIKLVAESIINQFQTKLGANTIRFGINYATVTDTSYWPKYKSIINFATENGFKIIIAYWEAESSKDGKVDNQAEFDAMWNIAVNDFKDNKNVYFEIFNEPHGYNLKDWKNFAAVWISKQIGKFHKKERILVGGSGYSENVAEVAIDKRFNGCLFSQHIYPWWSKFKTQAEWESNLGKRVGNFTNRTIVTEFGVAMKTRPNNYFTTLPINGEVDRAFLNGITNKIHQTNMGSVYWPGLRDGDDFSLTYRTGTLITITNSSGKDLVYSSYNK
jgi:endoglucanase